MGYGLAVPWNCAGKTNFHRPGEDNGTPAPAPSRHQGTVATYVQLDFGTYIVPWDRTSSVSADFDFQNGVNQRVLL